MTGCRADIVSLIQAMHHTFAFYDLDDIEGPDFQTFGDIALAFDLPNVYQKLTEDSLEVSQLFCCCDCRLGTCVSPTVPPVMANHLSSSMNVCILAFSNELVQ